MSLSTLEREAAPIRAFETEYTAVVIYGPEVVLDESYPHQSARRDAIVELLLANHDQVSKQDVDAILAPYGGAGADAALAEVFGLFFQYEPDLDMHLGERQRDVGPAVLYSAYTEYGDGTTVAEHYGSRDERLQQLRQRAANVAEGYPLEFFQNADETTCQKVIEYMLRPTNGRLHLFDAKRQAEGDAYITRNQEA
jgi:hypothetical protein